MPKTADMCTYQEVKRYQYDRWSVAPNGSAKCHDFYTVIISLQTWHAGQYAGYTYLIRDTYISNSPDYMGQIIESSSTFNSAPEGGNSV